MHEFVRLMDGTVMDAISFAGNTVLSLVNTVGVAFLFLAAFDYLYQWWDYEKNLRMSKQEIKEEYKQTEGEMCIRDRARADGNNVQVESEELELWKTYVEYSTLTSRMSKKFSSLRYVINNAGK